MPRLGGLLGHVARQRTRNRFARPTRTTTKPVRLQPHRDVPASHNGHAQRQRVKAARPSPAKERPARGRTTGVVRPFLWGLASSSFSGEGRTWPTVRTVLRAPRSSGGNAWRLRLGWRRAPRRPGGPELESRFPRGQVVEQRDDAHPAYGRTRHAATAKQTSAAVTNTEGVESGGVVDGASVAEGVASQGSGDPSGFLVRRRSRKE